MDSRKDISVPCTCEKRKDSTNPALLLLRRIGYARLRMEKICGGLKMENTTVSKTGYARFRTDIVNSLHRFERLKELANKNGGCVEATLYDVEIETIIHALSIIK